MISPANYVALAAILFVIGAVGVLVRRNALVVFMCVELMLNAVNLTFIALAQTLGVADQTHDAMFNAVWQSGELAVIDPATRGIKSRLPTIEDAAKFYKAKAGVPVDKFLETAKGFTVDNKLRAAEDLVQRYRVDRTPTIVVNGKYRLHTESAGGNDQLVELVKWLVAKESK